MTLHSITRRLDRPGPLVVAVHGSMDRSTSFARVLAAADLGGVAFDRRGYGRSPGPPAASVDEAVEDLLAVAAGARPDQAGGIVAVGHSFGGHVALRAGELRPDLVRAVVAYEPPLAWMPWYPTTTAGAGATEAPTPDGAAESFLRRMLGDAVWEGLPERTRARRRAEGAALLADMHAIRSGTAPWGAGRIGVPVVVAHGSAAAPHQVRGCEWLVEHLPRAELHVVDGAAHGGHRSHPETFAALVARAAALAPAG